MIETQLKLEQEMLTLCCERYINRFNENREKSFSTSQAATLIIKKVVLDFAEEIKKNFDETLSGQAGRYSTAVKCLLEINNPEKIAFIALKSVLNILYQKPTIHKVVNAIGDALDNEICLIKFKEKNKSYYNQVLDDLNKRNASLHWKNTVLNHKFIEKENFYSSHWTHVQKQYVGFFLFELLLPFGIVETKYIYEYGKTIKYVVPTEHFLKIIENLNDNLKILSPSFEPMVCTPAEWTGIYEGGYLIPHRKCRFIKHNDNAYLMRADKFGLENCYSAVTYIQNTDWCINKNVLSVVRELWKNNKSIGGLPNQEDVLIPSFPYPDKAKTDLTQEQKSVIKLWKQQATQQYRKNIQLRSLRMSTVQIIKIANKFEEYEKMYFPHQLDFRGRIYPIPILLQPQGCDLSKGLLTFSGGKPLDANGLKWLKIHIANCWGLSKENYESRLKWVDENTDLILNTASFPLTFLEWSKADKPFQFLAGCFELSGYLNDPDNYISTLPVSTDGACNALQHYSALLKDEKAGKSVNLIDSDKPNDIYQVVADDLIEKLHLQEDKQLSQQWLELGINRKLTKRPVMTLTYGATKYSCRDYIKDFLLDNFDINFLHNHFGKIGISPSNTIQKVSSWLADILWNCIKECLPSAVNAMEYLRKVARICAKKQKPIEWVTPMGMLVNQSYFATKQQRINTEIMGSLKVYKYRTEVNKYDTIRQVNGICPNFVHSLDASCLMLWVQRCIENGIYRFSPVHDSYGVLASDAELSQEILRNCFVEIYKTYDILEKFIDDITTDLAESEKEELPPPPPSFNLDLDEVIGSRYFFS